MSLKQLTDIIESLNAINAVKGDLAKAAQAVYDSWEQDEDGVDSEYGHGGICHDIASEMANVLNQLGIDSNTVSQTMDEVHVYVVAKTGDGVYRVDIPPSLYETGGGYVWKKKPGIKFDKSFITVDKLSNNPDDFEEFAND